MTNLVFIYRMVSDSHGRKTLLMPNQSTSSAQVSVNDRISKASNCSAGIEMSRSWQKCVGYHVGGQLAAVGKDRSLVVSSEVSRHSHGTKMTVCNSKMGVLQVLFRIFLILIFLIGCIFFTIRLEEVGSIFFRQLSHNAPLGQKFPLFMFIVDGSYSLIEIKV